MKIQADKNPAWRPLFRGLIDEQGYDLRRLLFNDPDFPTKAKPKPYEPPSDGRTFIVPKSGRMRELMLDGARETTYLDFLNLECGNEAHIKFEKFLSRYGPFARSKPESPSKSGKDFETEEVIFAASKFFRKYVGKIIDLRSQKPFLRCPDEFGKAKYLVHMDLDRGELVIETSKLYGFIYLQIADIFSRGLIIKNCDLCGAYMTPSRSTRKHCSDACRQKAHRARA
jgi:hypothetical protein